MIVFLYIIIILLLLIAIIFFSTITIYIDKIEIQNITKFSKLIDCIIIKNYNNFFDNIKILIKVQINLLHIVPVKIANINEKDFKKNITKRRKKNNNNKYTISRILKLKKIIKIKMINIKIFLGLSNAAYTAIISSILICLLTILISNIIDSNSIKYKNHEKQNYYEGKRFNFDVTPVFTNNIILNINIKTKISFSIYSVVKEIIMYKTYNFVNNTSKLKLSKGEVNI